MAIATLETLGDAAYPALIVCPNSMCYTWANEFHAWAPERKVAVVKGGAVARRKILASAADVFVMNWEGLRGHTRLAGYGYIKLSEKDKEPKELNSLDLRTVIADEAHRGKSPKAQQTRALWAVGSQARFRFALTGTPVANTPEDAWSIMHFVAPEEYPSKTAWIERYGLQQWNNFGGMTVVGIKGETREELFKILDPRFIRRPTQVVIPNIAAKLPPQIREIDLGSKQRKAYDALRKEMLAEVDSGVIFATNPLTRLLRLRQLAASYGEVDAEGNLRLTEPSAKLDALDDLYEELEGEQVCVFAESRQLIELAAARLMKAKVEHAQITGSVNAVTRQASVDAFQRGDLRVLLLTLGAGGEGLTLTASCHPIFIQRSFSQVKNMQAEDRTWRRGQDRPVQPIFIESRDTIEAHVREAGYDKEEMMEQVVRDKDTLRRLLLA